MRCDTLWTGGRAMLGAGGDEERAEGEQCVEGTSGLNCGGIAENWQELYADAAACCDGKLWWVEQNACVATSTGTTATAAAGSGNWYRKGEKCVKDCNDSSDAQCGGLAASWDQTFANSGDC